MPGQLKQAQLIRNTVTQHRMILSKPLWADENNFLQNMFDNVFGQMLMLMKLWHMSRMSVFTFESVQASNKRKEFNLNPTEKANVLVHIFYNCLAHILLSSEYTLERILIAQESFKIIQGVFFLWYPP